LFFQISRNRQKGRLVVHVVTNSRSVTHC
jgi:hypothetical protein